MIHCRTHALRHAALLLVYITTRLGVGRREFSVLRCVCLEIDFEFAVLLVVFWCNKHFPS